MYRLKGWAAIFGVVFLSTIALAGFSLAIYAAWLFHDLPDASQLIDYRPAVSTRVYSWDGTLIGEIGRERRIFAPYDQIPPILIKAFLAAEDRNFFEHGGLDISGIGRAMSRDAFNLLRGRKLQGGSTITQQVAKNILLGKEHSFSRKIKEAILARRIEETLPKTRILELYLNEIWLGYRSYGVAAAAFNYFGKSMNDLSLSEMAYLASLPKGPSNYDPIRHAPEAIRRRNWVLGQMAEGGSISYRQARDAMSTSLVVQEHPERTHYFAADYFMDEVKQKAMSILGQRVEDGGLYVRTTLDSKMQILGRKALMKGLEAYDRRHGWRGALAHLDPGSDWEKEALSQILPAERKSWRVALVMHAGKRGLRLSFPGHNAANKDTGELDPEDLAWARAGKGLTPGDLVFVDWDKDNHNYHLRQIPAVNGALVALDPRNGRVLSLVGGYSYTLSKFNRATQAQRQPGSAFKPFVYAAALENGFTPASIVLDAPISFAGSNGVVWSPENYGHGSAGPTIFRNGLVFSRNQMTVRIADRIGMIKVRDMAIRAGIVDDLQPVLSMALGAGETTPLRLTGAYSIFVNGGRKVEPHLIEQIQDRQGQTNWVADNRMCNNCTEIYKGQNPPHLEPQGLNIMDPITAYQINLMLQGVTTNGTAAAVARLGRHIGGKTGTTNDYRSAWFVGYTPSLVIGVFVGFDDNHSLGEGETGANVAVPIFMDFVNSAMEGYSVSEDFIAPKDANLMYIHGHLEAFKPGSEPRNNIIDTPGSNNKVQDDIDHAINRHPFMVTDEPPETLASPQ